MLAAAFNPALHPAGFRIRNRILALSFKHDNSFIPIYAKSDWSFKRDAGQQLAYWDDKGYVQPWIAPAPTQAELDRIPKGPKADEDAKIDKDMMAFLGELEDEEAPDVVPAAIGPGSSAVVAAAAPAALPAPGSIAPISMKPIATASKPAHAPSSVPPASSTSRPPKEVPVAGIVPVGPAASLGGASSPLHGDNPVLADETTPPVLSIQAKRRKAI